MLPRQELGSNMGKLAKNSLEPSTEKYLKLIRWEDGLLLDGLLLVLEHCAAMAWGCLTGFELLESL